MDNATSIFRFKQPPRLMASPRLPDDVVKKMKDDTEQGPRAARGATRGDDRGAEGGAGPMWGTPGWGAGVAAPRAAQRSAEMLNACRASLAKERAELAEHRAALRASNAELISLRAASSAERGQLRRQLEAEMDGRLAAETVATNRERLAVSQAAELAARKDELGLTQRLLVEKQARLAAVAAEVEARVRAEEAGERAALGREHVAELEAARAVAEAARAAQALLEADLEGAASATLAAARRQASVQAELALEVRLGAARAAHSVPPPLIVRRVAWVHGVGGAQSCEAGGRGQGATGAARAPAREEPACGSRGARPPFVTTRLMRCIGELLITTENLVHYCISSSAMQLLL
jgi:hypothetical protein